MDHSREEKESVGHVVRNIISNGIVGCTMPRRSVLSRKTSKSRVKGVGPDDIGESCILGLDLLQQQRCQLNITVGILSMGNVQVHLLYPLTYDLNMLCYRVIALEDINIQSHTEAVIPAKVVDYTGKNGWGIIEPADEESSPGVFIGKVLTKLTNEPTIVPIRMVNVTEETRKVLAGTDLAKCETVSFVVCPDFENCFEESTTRNEIPKHLAELYESSTKDLIITGSAKPIKQPPRRLPLAKRDVACQAVDKMLKGGVIETSTSPWSSTVVLVAKKNGTLRFCVDYRKLNDATIKDSYPLPKIDDTLDALGGSQWFSMLDLKSGFGKLLWIPQTKKKRHSALAGVYGIFETFSEQLENLRKVFTYLRKANLKLSPEKCNLFRREVKYLGHIISCKGVGTGPANINSVKDWPRPTYLAEMRSFFGLCSYYRTFIRNFAEIANPLTRLTQKDVQFVCDSEAENAFQQMK
ncbi:Retrovirus-related Pol poly from transposon 412, partial, partial [Paramuricea clavata]